MQMKQYFTILILAIFLSGCSLTQSSNGGDAVATEVAKQLTTLPTSTLGQQQPTAPVLPVATQTPVPSTATVKPSPTPSITPSITLTPTANLSDPATYLGKPAWETTFSDGKSFGLGSSGYKDEHSYIRVDNGSMVMTSYGKIAWRTWRLTSPTVANMYLEAEFKTQTCSGVDQYGIVFRAPDYDSGFGYYLGLSCEGKVSLSVWDSAGTSFPLEWTNSDLILAGANQSNRLGILAKGSSLKIYINGKLFQEVTDSALSDAGHFGAFIAGKNTEGFTVEMGKIGYWNLQ